VGGEDRQGVGGGARWVVVINRGVDCRGSQTSQDFDDHFGAPFSHSLRKWPIFSRLFAHSAPTHTRRILLRGLAYE